MSGSFDARHPGRFTAGAVGEPGHRTFYFQLFADGEERSVKCEKQQAAALAEHLVKLLADLPEAPDPGSAPPAEALPPTTLDWTVGSISLGIDTDAQRVVVVLEEFADPEDPDAPDEPARVRIWLTPEQVRAYAAQVEALVSASRPLCRLCEHPIDPAGHACPRLN